MAGSVPKIVGNFTVDKGLEERPVFFLTVGGKKLVVKGEAKGDTGYDRSDEDTSLSVKWGAKMMKNVNDPLVNTKIMEDNETQAFLEVAQRKFKPLPTPPGGDPIQPSRQYSYVSQQAQRFLWVKMPMVEGLTDADIMKKVGGFSKPVPKKAKEMIIKFTDETLWPQLGKVLAVDIFNGNNDRFDIETGKWINYGNVMFTNAGAKVIGLDTFDPNTTQSNLAGPGRYDALKTLTDPMKQKEFSLKCAKSVGAILSSDAFQASSAYITLPVQGPNGRVHWKVTADEIKSLYEPFAPAMAAGIAKGAGELKTYLQNKVRQYKLRSKPLPQPPGAPAIPGRAPAAPPGVRPRAGGAPPPRPNPAYRHAAAVEGIPQGILDRMHYLGWLQ